MWIYHLCKIILVIWCVGIAIAMVSTFDLEKFNVNHALVAFTICSVIQVLLHRKRVTKFLKSKFGDEK